MRLGVYAVYDLVAEKFAQPFTAETDRLAIRSYQIGLANISDLISKDYELHCLGYFDNEDGNFQNIGHYKVYTAYDKEIQRERETDEEE